MTVGRGRGGGILVLGDNRAGRGGGGLVLGDSRAGRGAGCLYWVTIGRGGGGDACIG